MLRRAADVVGSVILLVLSAPVLLIAVIAVLVGSGRPVFFRQKRLGKDGQVFRCWKLRTMNIGAEHELEREPLLKLEYVANGFKLPNGKDPRITREGRWLRRTYLDEVPQLFNVLDGSMSLIGPRPIVPEELVHYGGEGDELLRTKPGIVGAWTSHGRRRPDYPERARVELEYVRNRSTRRDLAIMLRSIPVVLRGQDDG
jgi:lipopolysaccharide/colanic/teichoic acid biosynthesis glycosyltransferase